MLKKFWRKIFPRKYPMPAYGYQFISIDYDNMTECKLIARCNVTKELYCEALIVPCNFKILQRNRSRTLIIKGALCAMMNDRLGVNVEAPKI